MEEVSLVVALCAMLRLFDLVCVSVKTDVLESSVIAPLTSLITYSCGLIERLHSVSFPSVWMPGLHLMDSARSAL